MKTDKPFKTIDEQMALLKSRNLTFGNVDTVKSSLTNMDIKNTI